MDLEKYQHLQTSTPRLPKQVTKKSYKKKKHSELQFKDSFLKPNHPFVNYRTLCDTRFLSNRTSVETRKAFIRFFERIIHEVQTTNDKDNLMYFISTLLEIFITNTTKHTTETLQFKVKKFGTISTTQELRNCFLIALKRLYQMNPSPFIIKKMFQFSVDIGRFTGKTLLNKKDTYHHFYSVERFAIANIGYYLLHNQPEKVIPLMSSFPQTELLMKSEIYTGYIGIAYYQIFQKGGSKNEDVLDRVITSFKQSIAISTKSCYFLNKFYEIILRESGEELALDLLLSNYKKKRPNLYLLQFVNIKTLKYINICSMILTHFKKYGIPDDYTEYLEIYTSLYSLDDNFNTLLQKEEYLDFDSTLKSFLQRIECRYSIDELVSCWEQFYNFLLKQDNIKEIATTTPFCDKLWKNRHFPQSIDVVSCMNEDVKQIKQKMYLLLYTNND
ncbi:Uncharacterized protein QTN25_000788 [Entamoeba marina]